MTKNKIFKLLTSREFILYASIGVTGVILDFIIFALLYNVFDISPVIATSVSVLFGITNNFVLNTFFNFKKKDKIFARYVMFLCVGLFGLVVSAYVLAMGELFGVDGNLTKLISLPIIVLLQYSLNKNISFRDFSSKKSALSHLLSFARKHWGIILINLIFVFVSLFFIKNIPASAPYGGPDESTHYQSNVAFILKNHRLPVSGVDDLEDLQQCRSNKYGAVPCKYSYVIYPPVNYIFSAATSIVVHDITGISYFKAARFASLIWGLVFVNIIYLTAMRLTKNRKISWLVASICLLPQIIFISSYTNQDAHSLAIGALVVYSLVGLLQKKSHSSIVIAAIAIGGLLPLAKYNYFILVPLIAITLIYSTTTKIITFYRDMR